MLSVYLDQCAPISAYLPVSSLNDVINPEADLGFEVEVIETLPDLTVDLEAECCTRQNAAKAAAFIRALPRPLASIVIRHYWHGETQTEIAEDLGVTRSAISHALSKVNRLGREFFGESVH